MSDSFNEDEQEEIETPQPAVKISAPAGEPLYPVTEDGGNDDSIWMTSYADLMTLIACFFILLVAFANFDPESFSRRSKEMAKHFSGEKLVDGSDDPITQLMAKLEEDSDLKKSASIKMEMDGIVINFSGSALFDSGRAQLKPEVLDALDIMIDLIHEKSPTSRIIVEGHTDDVPLINSSKYSNNWELSGARAATVIERFEEFGLIPKNLVAVGYGSTRPLKPNHDENGIAILENMKENRRVVIKVMKAPQLMKREKLGLGVYFDDNKILDSSAPQKDPGVKVEVNGQEVDQNPPRP